MALEIHIEHEGEGNNKTLHWQSTGDGRQTMWIMADALIGMYEYFFNEPLRPVYEPKKGRVCIEFADEKLAIAFRPEDDIIAAKALTSAALVALAKLTHGKVDPFQVMFGSINTEADDLWQKPITAKS
jgi:hypothetical protein